MNFTAVIIAIMIALLISFLIFILASLVIKKISNSTNFEFYRNIVVIIILCITAKYTYIMILPHVERYEIKRNIEKHVYLSPLYSYLMRNKPEKYEEIIDGIVSKVEENRGKSAEIIYSSLSNYNRKYMSFYIKSASDESIINYAEKYINFMELLRNDNPDMLCRLISPEIFGLPDMKIVSNYYQKSGFFGAILQVIKSGEKFEYNKNDINLYVKYNNYKINYIKNNKNKINVDTINSNSSDEEKKKYPENLLNFYKSILKLNQNDSSLYFRYTFVK